MLLSAYPQRDPEVNFQHAARQAYIGLSAAMVAAAFEEVDCTPMEGFDPAALDEILGLRARGLRSARLAPSASNTPGPARARSAPRRRARRSGPAAWACARAVCAAP